MEHLEKKAMQFQMFSGAPRAVQHAAAHEALNYVTHAYGEAFQKSIDESHFYVVAPHVVAPGALPPGNISKFILSRF
jgi:hypothetical protein